MGIIFLQASILLLSLMTLLWILSVIIKNASIVDIFWGIGFVIVNAFYFSITENIYTRNIILLILVSLWGTRLSTYIGWRNIGKGEDFRYQQFRQNYGPQRYWWFSYFQVFLLQGILLMIISLPLLGAHHNTNSNNLNWLDYLGMLLWVIGFFFESVGDIQMALFKRKKENKGKVLNKGLWKYTRHPNYFGDSTVWSSYGIICMASGIYWPIIGSILMTILIIKVSGVYLLERSLKNKKPEYIEYIRKTSAFVPWFPKK